MLGWLGFSPFLYNLKVSSSPHGLVQCPSVRRLILLKGGADQHPTGRKWKLPVLSEAKASTEAASFTLHSIRYCESKEDVCWEISSPNKQKTSTKLEHLLIFLISVIPPWLISGYQCEHKIRKRCTQLAPVADTSWQQPIPGIGWPRVAVGEDCPNARIPEDTWFTGGPLEATTEASSLKGKKDAQIDHYTVSIQEDTVKYIKCVIREHRSTQWLCQGLLMKIHSRGDKLSLEE